jgi:predicted small lipoprotein YifL
MRKLIVLGLIVTLAGCGQRAPAPYSNSGPLIVRSAATASGPISRACMASPRKGKSAQLCGCIQAAADQTLSRSQQNRATQFYIDPHKAQEVRQSDRRSDEEFWKAYRAYGERAEQMCG